MNREECLETFTKFGVSEEYVINAIVTIYGCASGSKLELKGLPKKAYLTTDLDIVFQNGKRFSKLEEAIKTIANM